MPGRPDACFPRGPVRSLDRSPAISAPSERGGSFNRSKSDRVSPSRTAAPAAIGQTELHRVVLVESDQYYREVLTFELLRQGFIVHAFTGGASLLASLATAVDADLAVLDWDLPRMPGLKLLAELRQHGVKLPVVFLAGKVIAGDENDRCVLAHAAVEERLACGKLLLKPETGRANWDEIDVDLTLGEYKIVHLLVANVGSFVTYRTLYDRLRYEGFMAGTGEDGFRANIRSTIKRIRNKFRACDPAFDEIENYTGFGYCWRKPS